MSVAHRLQRTDRKSVVVFGLLLGSAALGFAARFWLAAISAGSGDIIIWVNFASLIDQHGVAYMYQNQGIYNHPPLQYK